MPLSCKLSSIACLLSLSLSASTLAYAGSSAPKAPITLSNIESVKALDNQHWLVSSEAQGLNLINQQQQAIAQVKGKFEQIDARTWQTDQGRISVVAAVNKAQNALDLYRFHWQSQTFSLLSRQKISQAGLDGVCLKHNTSENALYAFLIKADMPVEQRWVLDTATLAPQQKVIRELPISHGITSCAVDDNQQAIYIAEALVGIWQFSTHAEAEPDRQPLSLLQPFGRLSQEIEQISVLDDGSVLVSQTGTKQAVRVKTQHKLVSGLPAIEHITLNSAEVEALDGIWQQDTLQLGYYGEDIGLQLIQQTSQAQTPAKLRQFAVVPALVETTPVAKLGDAADDPAIWFNPKQPQKSLVLGTDKQAGLGVYDLQGQELQFIASGRINNVDLVDSFTLNGQDVALASASQRDHNSIALYAIDKRSQQVTELDQVPTNLPEVYGLCMAQYQQQTYVLINDKDGRYQQYAISQDSTGLQGQLVREFKLADQPEGCDVNQATGELFVGVEDMGIWVTHIDPQRAMPLRSVFQLTDKSLAAKWLKDDIEGLAVYQNGDNSYLVVSSQGNDSYALFKASQPYSYLGSFRVTANLYQGIDGASETDGLDVSSANFGGEFSQGMLVVQDGRNVMPVQPQNFKYVAFSSILKQLGLPAKAP
ncbi:phytase [Saccharobesus litoralis]|nr:phytase [Saccharobesus litoralis]